MGVGGMMEGGNGWKVMGGEAAMGSLQHGRGSKTIKNISGIHPLSKDAFCNPVWALSSSALSTWVSKHEARSD